VISERDALIKSPISDPDNDVTFFYPDPVRGSSCEHFIDSKSVSGFFDADS
jgi:hypothetical protein